MRRPLLLFVLMFLVPCLGRAQNAGAPDQAEQIKALLARVELLEREVATLKANQVAMATPAPAVAAPPSPAAAPPPEVTPVSKAMVQGQEHEQQMAQQTVREMEVH